MKKGKSGESLRRRATGPRLYRRSSLFPGSPGCVGYLGDDMKLLKKIAVVVVALGSASVGLADPTIVGDKEWRQVTQTMGLTWFQVASVCDTTTGVCNGAIGSVDFTDWVWASAFEVGELFNLLTPHPGGLAKYKEINSQWAPEFFDRFYPTEVRADRTFIRGLTRTTFQSSGGPAVQAYAAIVADSTDPANPDIANNTDNANRGFVYDVTGVWLYRTASVPVTIDIKPGSDPNCFNINGHGVIPVAILGSDTFDVSTIDQTTLLFGGMAVRVRGNKGPLCGFENPYVDGYTDLVCHFEDDPTNWDAGNAEATLTGKLDDGTDIVGTDTICVVP
jgi:hypothetical protein